MQLVLICGGSNEKSRIRYYIKQCSGTDCTSMENGKQKYM